MLAEHARRLRDGHRAQMRAIGMKQDESSGGGEDMGNIFVTGDIHTQDGRPEALPWYKPAPPKRTAWWVPALLGAAGLATGVGAGPTLIKWLSAAYSITQGQQHPDSEWTVRLVPEGK